MMEAQTPHACGVDDIACHLRCLRQILFFVWVSLNEQKWSLLVRAEDQAYK